MRRRALLATCAAVGLAGCLGDDSAAGTPGTDADGGTAASPGDGGSASDATTAGETAVGPETGSGTGSAASPASGPTATGPATTGPGTTRPATSTARGTPTATPIHASYETTEVDLTTPGGEVLGAVTAAIADTGELRYTGLSDTESLPSDRGMLFVYGQVQDLTYVMREMDFGIDIIYADDEAVITRIHHAPAPGPDENGNEQRYPGRGQYVLEVNYEYTTEHGVEEGDVLEFDL